MKTKMWGLCYRLLCILCVGGTGDMLRKKTNMHQAVNNLRVCFDIVLGEMRLMESLESLDLAKKTEVSQLEIWCQVLYNSFLSFR